MNRTAKHNGNTLLETVVYVAILAAMALLSINAILIAYRTMGVLRIDRTISSNGDVALETMIREIRNASSIDAGTSIFNSSPGVLKIGTKTFSRSGTTLQEQDGSNPIQSLTSSDVAVTSITFYHMATSSASLQSEIVSMRMTIQAGKGYYSRTKQFFASAVLRGEYR